MEKKDKYLLLPHQSTPIYNMRRRLQKGFCRLVGPKIVNSVYYRYLMKKNIELKPPKTLSEKICWIKLYHAPKSKLIIKCSDKYSVREYLKEKGLEEYLPNLIGAWKNTDDIDWDALPKRFAIKCSHGCGYNIICLDKDRIDKAVVYRTLNEWLNDDFGYYNGELHYNYSDRMIICEEYIDSDTKLPIDYKVHCFNGKAITIMGCFERESGKTRFFFYNMDGTPNDYGKEVDRNSLAIERKLLEEMKNVSEIIAEDFELVRVDFYIHHNQLKIGELTLVPGAGYLCYLTEEAESKLGDMLDISNLYNS